VALTAAQGSGPSSATSRPWQPQGLDHSAAPLAVPACPDAPLELGVLSQAEDRITHVLVAKGDHVGQAERAQGLPDVSEEVGQYVINNHGPG
jgi:hypothetical protein